MGAYVVFTKLRPEGCKRLVKNPQRFKEIRAEVEKHGAKITQQYSVMGEYDFVTFIEAPGNDVIAKVGAEISSLGTTKHTTLPAFSLDRFQELLKMQPYRTEPHAWQTAWWASAVRRVGRYWTTTRYVRQYCKPLTVEGGGNLDGCRGPAIIIANHSSHFDSPTVYAALPGRIRNKIAMAAAADKFYASRKKRIWWPSLFQGAFPVHRGGGTKQLEYPLALMKKGYSILIYPEGGRSKSGQIARFKAGPAIMAMGGKAPVIPIYMEGLRAIMPKGDKYPKPGPVHVRIGKPVSLVNAVNVREATEMLENAMRELAGQAPHHHPVPQAADLAGAAATAGGGR